MTSGSARRRNCLTERVREDGRALELLAVAPRQERALVALGQRERDALGGGETGLIGHGQGDGVGPGAQHCAHAGEALGVRGGQGGVAQLAVEAAVPEHRGDVVVAVGVSGDTDVGKSV